MTDEQAAVAPIVPASVLAEATADAGQASIATPGDAAGAPSPAPIPVPAPVDYDAEARDVVAFAWALFGPLYPSLAPIYTDPVRARIAVTLAPVMRKYGWDMSGLGAEAALAMAVLPVVIPTVRAVRLDNEQRAKARTSTDSQPKAATSVPSNVNTSVSNVNTDVTNVKETLGQRFPGMA